MTDVGGQVHQHRFVGLCGEVGHAQRQGGAFAVLCVGEVQGVQAQADVADGVRMRAGEVLDFLHHLAAEAQVDHVRLGVGEDGHRLIKMPQRLGIERHADRPFLAGGDGRLGPLGHGAGAVGFHLAQHQGAVARVGDDIFRRDGLLPLDLPEAVLLGVRGEAGLCGGGSRQASRCV